MRRTGQRAEFGREMSGAVYLLMLLLCALVAALVAFFAASTPDVEIRQLPEIQPVELRD